MKSNDIVNIYTDFLNFEHFEGQAKLINHLITNKTFVNNCGKLKEVEIQEWEVEFTDRPGEIYKKSIRIS